MEIIKLKINEIKPYKNNAKMHTKEQIEQIKKSITEFGMNDPIAIWGKNNIIVEGHGRLLALKELGYKEVECIRLDHLTDEERKAYTLTHNKLTMNTDFDYDILETELEDIDEIDMTEFGFVEDISYIDDLLENEFANSNANIDIFSVTFNFDIEDKEEVLSYIKENGKEHIVKSIVEMIHNA